MTNKKKSIGTYPWVLSKECLPEAGSLIDTHLGVSIVEKSIIINPAAYREWRTSSIKELGEENVLLFFDEEDKDPFFTGRGGLALKLFTTTGPKWVLMAHTVYNREGPITIRTWWLPERHPTFTQPRFV